jgi:hypothetical protein
LGYVLDRPLALFSAYAADKSHEQDLARQKQNAAQSHPGAASPMAPGTPETVLLPRSPQELAETPQAKI